MSGKIMIVSDEQCDTIGDRISVCTTGDTGVVVKYLCVAPNNPFYPNWSYSVLKNV